MRRRDEPPQRVIPQRSAAQKPSILEHDMSNTAPFDFHNDGLVVEFKRSASDPFNTVQEMLKTDWHTLERRSDKSREIRGQLASYATELFAHQHRTHLFQILIFGKYARFLRCDRAGAIVSGRFNYIEDSDLLAEFIWRYNHTTDEERGLDTTVTYPTEDERKAFAGAVNTFVEEVKTRNPSQKNLAELEKTMKNSYPMRKVSVEDDDGGETLELIIQRPFHHPRSPMGRATRNYLAFDPQEGEMYVLKDTWRVDHGYLMPESEVYKTLKAHKVPHIPDVICAGDVKVNGEKQKTFTQEWAVNNRKRARSGPLRTHYHHRIVQKFAYTIDVVCNSRQFISVMGDCLEGQCTS